VTAMLEDAPPRLTYTFHVEGQDFATAGEVSSKIRRILQQLGVHPDTIRRTSVAAYEAEMNVVIHAYRADVTLETDDRTITITVKDEGPGIPDIEQAMQPGFSTAPEEIREMGFGAGMGLANMDRCADRLEIESVVGQGTTVRMVFNNTG